MAFTTLDAAPRRPTEWLGHGQNHGAVTHSVASHGLLVNATEHAPGSSIARHAHADAYLCVVVEGGFEMSAGRSIECVAGSVLAHPQGHAHANRFGAGAGHCINIHFGASWLQERVMVDWLADFRHAPLGLRAPSIRRLIREMRSVDAATPLALVSVAAELVADAMRAPSSRAAPRWLERVVDAIESDLAQPPSLGALAAQAGAHPSHLCRVFRARYGETIGEYLRRRRVEESVVLLAAGDLSIAEVAAACGFADQSHYARLFKRRFGSTPGARRREMQRLS
ncbi:MAG: AraC family transcriptional regulator [Caldimonas sp.]|nr:AraC family transcriptional regulator [Pseudomonadota bacterium]